MGNAIVLEMADSANEPVGSRARAPKWAKRTTRLSLYTELVLLDLAAVIGGFFAASRLWGTAWLTPEGVNVMFPVALIYSTLTFYGSGYSIEILRSRPESIRCALRSLMFTLLLLALLAYYTRVSDDVSRGAFATGIALTAVLLVAGRWFFFRYCQFRLDGPATDELLIVDGVALPDHAVRYVIDAEADGLSADLQDPQMLGRLATIVRKFDRVIVAAMPDRQHAWSLLLKGSDIAGEIVLLEGNQLGAIGFARFSGLHTAQVSRGSLSFSSRAKKRALDLAVALPALVLLAPLMIMVAIAIKIDDPGPVLFRQQRTGRGNRSFEMLKFRSMRMVNCDADGAQSTRRDDDRVTRVGRFIRSTSIDELPQLLNVLSSDMSVVGPRPHALGSLAGDKLFWQVNERYWLRHALKPGITGLAQVRGFRGATHMQQDLEKRLQSDLEYVNGWTLWRDIVIIFKTFGVLTHRNAY
jgi:polysaccharide biosynthesis protein PslA